MLRTLEQPQKRSKASGRAFTNLPNINKHEDITMSGPNTPEPKPKPTPEPSPTPLPTPTPTPDPVGGI